MTDYPAGPIYLVCYYGRKVRRQFYYQLHSVDVPPPDRHSREAGRVEVPLGAALKGLKHCISVYSGAIPEQRLVTAAAPAPGMPA
jgi:hypothetical protein